jgi:hypothetical protein
MSGLQLYKNLFYLRNRRLHKSLLFISHVLFLFLSGTITLKTIFRNFQNYIFKRYQCVNQHFEKPASLLFQEYRIAPLLLHLKQWLIANETESLMHLHFAQIKRNPE